MLNSFKEVESIFLNGSISLNCFMKFSKVDFAKNSEKGFLLIELHLSNELERLSDPE